MSEVKAVPRKRRKIRLFHVFLVLLIIAAGAFTIYRIHLKHKLHSRIEAIRASGYPVTMEELEKMYPVAKDTENAADIILDAMDNYYREPNSEDIKTLQTDSYISSAPALAKPISKETVTHMGQYLKENGKALEMLHKTSALQYSRYPSELSDPNRPGTSVVLTITNAVNLLNLETIYFSETGDSELALRSIICSFNIANSPANEPRLIFHCNRMLYFISNIYTLKRIINRVDFSEEQLIELDKYINDSLDFSDFPNVFTGEMCRLFDILNNDDNITTDIVPNRVPLPIAQFYIFFYKHLGIVDDDRILTIDYMSRYIEAAKLPLQERYNTFQKIAKEANELSHIHLLTAIFPALDRNLDRDRQIITQIQTAKTAIAVKRFCLAKGFFPGTLNDLIPAFLDSIPIDPDGKELKYKIIDEGCIIYSESNERKNIRKALPPDGYIDPGIPNLGAWFMLEYDNEDAQ